jgi:hypothetical protein
MKLVRAFAQSNRPRSTRMAQEPASPPRPLQQSDISTAKPHLHCRSFLPKSLIPTTGAPTMSPWHSENSTMVVAVLTTQRFRRPSRSTTPLPGTYRSPKDAASKARMALGGAPRSPCCRRPSSHADSREGPHPHVG